MSRLIQVMKFEGTSVRSADQIRRRRRHRSGSREESLRRRGGLRDVGSHQHFDRGGGKIRNRR